MTIRKSVLTVTVFTLLTAATAQAGQFKRSQIAGNAIFVAHADLETLKTTDVGQYILSQSQTEEADRKLGAFAAMFGFDPRRDLRGITVYTTPADQKRGAVLLDGAFDCDRLETLVRGADNYEVHPYGEFTIHSWVDKNKNGKRLYGAFQANNLIVMSENLTVAQAALDVLNDKKPGLTVGGLADQLPPQPAVFFMAAANMDALRNLNPQSDSLKNVRGGSLCLAEKAGAMHGDLTIVAADADSANKLLQIGQGMLALGAFNQQKDPNLAKLINAARLSVQGLNVTLTLDLPAADIVNAMKNAKEKKMGL